MCLAVFLLSGETYAKKRGDGSQICPRVEAFLQRVADLCGDLCCVSIRLDVNWRWFLATLGFVGFFDKNGYEGCFFRRFSWPEFQVYLQMDFFFRAGMGGKAG
jgi:hypothetical protein